MAEEKPTTEEDIELSYVALSVGPMGKDVSTMATHLSTIGYFQRVRRGIRPLAPMSRAHLIPKGPQRA